VTHSDVAVILDAEFLCHVCRLTRPAPQEALGTVPLVTLTITFACIAVYVACNLVRYEEAVQAFSLSPFMVVYGLQVYRIVTAAFMHGGLLHIGMNMLSLLSLGSSLEPQMGTLRFFFLVLLYTLFIGGGYVAASFAWAAAASGWVGYSPHVPVPPVLITGAVGFSGVLFAMAVDESANSAAPTRSVFGLFNVPTKLYPWVLMALIQIVMPMASFLGHFIGAVVGMAHAAGALDWLLPSMVTLRAVEDSGCMRATIVRWRPYKLTPSAEILRSSENSFRATGAVMLAALATLARPCTDCVRARTGGGGRPSSAAAATASPSSSRRVGADGRLGRPAEVVTAQVQLEGEVVPGQGGAWSAGALLAAGSSGTGYVRVAGSEEAGTVAVPAGSPPPQVAADPAAAAVREAMRAKAARAAEARLAATR